MKVEWIFIDERRPSKSGNYTVIWSEPYYSKEPVMRTCFYFKGKDRFTDNPSGANEVLYWLDGLEIPVVDKELKNRRLE